MKHTSGPWEWYETSEGYCRVISARGGLIVAECSVRNPFSEEQRANAALIAAAPEMLDLLMEMASYWSCDTYDEDKLDSSAIGAHADVLRLLARFGKVTIEYDKGRRVIAKVKK